MLQIDFLRSCGLHRGVSVCFAAHMDNPLPLARTYSEGHSRSGCIIHFDALLLLLLLLLLIRTCVRMCVFACAIIYKRSVAIKLLNKLSALSIYISIYIYIMMAFQSESFN